MDVLKTKTLKIYNFGNIKRCVDIDIGAELSKILIRVGGLVHCLRGSAAYVL